jgi:hypothetical protein
MELKKKRLKEVAGRFIVCCWRRYRLRYFCYGIIIFGREKLRIRKDVEDREEREFRIRTSYRRIVEEKQLNQWKIQKQAIKACNKNNNDKFIDENNELVINGENEDWETSSSLIGFEKTVDESFSLLSPAYKTLQMLTTLSKAQILRIKSSQTY